MPLHHPRRCARRTLPRMRAARRRRADESFAKLHRQHPHDRGSRRGLSRTRSLRTHRPGRHGRRLPGAPATARPGRRLENSPARARRAAGLCRAFHPRGPRARAARASAHRRPLRLWGKRGLLLPHHGAREWRESLRRDARRSEAGAGAAARAAHLRGAAICPRSRRAASRHQAREHPP